MLVYFKCNHLDATLRTFVFFVLWRFLKMKQGCLVNTSCNIKKMTSTHVTTRWQTAKRLPGLYYDSAYLCLVKMLRSYCFVLLE